MLRIEKTGHSGTLDPKVTVRTQKTCSFPYDQTVCISTDLLDRHDIGMLDCLSRPCDPSSKISTRSR